jgi:thymidylate synthase (FAD)
MTSHALATRRPVVEAMESRIGQAVPCLDHGFVRLVDYMGDDAAIAAAARVSYGAGTRHTRPDRDLIRHLLRNSHTSPFEMCEIKLHVKLPIFVARQWIRHRTANVNEVSGRYSVLDREFYLPAAADLEVQSKDDRQGRAGRLPEGAAQEVLELLRSGASADFSTYDELLGRHDLTRELARIGLPLSTYTQWVWKIDLHNLLHFLALRLDSHAQREIRVYADVIAGIVQDWVPTCWEAFTDYLLEARTLSRLDLAVVRARLQGREVSFEESGLSKREWRELNAVLGLVPPSGPERAS